MSPFAQSLAPPAPSPQPDETLARLVESRMKQTSHFALQSVRCELHQGTAVLHGVLPNASLKQLAQDLARQTQGVRRIINQIVIAPWEASDEEHRRL
jgi:osmotically-inducible protein OsmY